MAIKIGASFNYKAQQFNFERDGYTTMALMKAVRDVDVPNGFISVCQETDYFGLWQYNYANESDPNTGKWRKASADSDVFTDVEELPEEDISSKTIYRMRTDEYLHGDNVLDTAPTGYQVVDSEHVVVNGTGITVNGIEVLWDSVDSVLIDSLLSQEQIAVSTFNNAAFFLYTVDSVTGYDIASSIIKRDKYLLFHNPTETVDGYISLGGGSGNYNELTNKPTIDNFVIEGNKTHEDYELVSERDIVSSGDVPAVKDDGLMMVYGPGDPEEPVVISEINDDPTLKYAEDYTSSNKHINTGLDSKQDKFRLGISLEETTENDVKYLNVKNVNYDNNIINKPKLDGNIITGDKTRQDYKLLGEDDFINSTESFVPKSDGMDVLLPEGTPNDPIVLSEIDDSASMKYSQYHTSSNQYINTNLDSIYRILNGTLLIEFVATLPSPVQNNHQYWVSTSDPNIYHIYTVDSLGTVKDMGLSQHDFSQYVSQEDLVEALESMQQKLIAGEGIVIDPNTNTISADIESVATAVVEAVQPTLDLKQDKLTDSDETSDLSDDSKFSLVNATDKTNQRWGFNKLWTWVLSKITSICEKGIQISNGKIGHSNSITAQTNNRIYSGTLDAQGHYNADPTALEYSNDYTTDASNNLFTRTGAYNMYNKLKYNKNNSVIKIGDGLEIHIETGISVAQSGTQTKNFATAFPNNCWAVIATPSQPGYGANAVVHCSVNSKSQYKISQAGGVAAMGVTIIAFGN